MKGLCAYHIYLFVRSFVCLFVGQGPRCCKGVHQSEYKIGMHRTWRSEPNMKAKFLQRNHQYTTWLTPMPPVFILKDETLTFELQSQSLRIRMNKRTNERMKELTNKRVRECKGSSSLQSFFSKSKLFFGKTYSPRIWLPEYQWIWFTQKQIQLLKTGNMLSRRHLNPSSTKTHFLTVASSLKDQDHWKWSRSFGKRSLIFQYYGQRDQLNHSTFFSRPFGEYSPAGENAVEGGGGWGMKWQS